MKTRALRMVLVMITREGETQRALQPGRMIRTHGESAMNTPPSSRSIIVSEASKRHSGTTVRSCMEVADPGWYNREGDKTAPHEFWSGAAAAVRAGQVNGTLGKPLVISETGAGGIYEWSDNTTDVKWSLLYQAEIIAGDVDEAISNENISGITLWHLYDCMSFRPALCR